jgi:nitrite reductase/ring-hydroxylating ferredoxin subunit
MQHTSPAAEGATSGGPAPPESQFAAYPRSWYLFGPAREVRRGPVAKTLFNTELVAFRTAGGRAAVLGARCAHLGANLGKGRVVGEAIRCPYHHWQYGADGRCVHIPSQGDVPAFARQASYPCVERHGYLYVFNGRQSLFDLPFFAGCRPEEMRADRTPLRFVAEAPWYMFAANIFDANHFLTQHNRRLVGALEVDTPHPFARRVRFQWEITGASRRDRLLRACIGGRVRVSVTCWGGNVFFVTGAFRRAVSYVHVMTQPLASARGVYMDQIVYVRRFRSRLLGGLLEPPSLRLRRLLSAAFLGSEVEELAGIRYSPHTLIASDRPVIDFFCWAAGLPR